MTLTQKLANLIKTCKQKVILKRDLGSNLAEIKIKKKEKTVKRQSNNSNHFFNKNQIIKILAKPCEAKTFNPRYAET